MSAPSETVHIINHTHWDRDWFLTSTYTSQWLPNLVDRLERLATLNPEYHFLLDGQTLVVEDLIKISPEHARKCKNLIEGSNLIIGPYYCQPDWLMTGGEAIIRNLLYGRHDMESYGAENHSGWLVDTFGHISQAPQVHRLCDIDSVYVWRGVPCLDAYFAWHSPDSSELLTVNLIGGYRNLYGVTSTPDLAIQRLITEVEKLQPFYPTPDIPLFDGYDLENDPEDPLLFFAQLGETPADLLLKEDTPQVFADTVAGKLKALPVIQGELNTGKYAATFPGTLSARTYLKIMARDCEYLLYQVCEPLAVLARLCGRPYPSGTYETWARTLLQNAVHDCLCGVSIDLVHEKMEFTYRQVFDGLQADIAQSLGYILEDFALGTYAVSTNPIPSEAWHIVQDKLIHTRTNGVGIWPVEAALPVNMRKTPVKTFNWRNDHYEAAVSEDGSVQVGAGTLGRLVVFAEKGDAYSDELGGIIGTCHLAGGIVIEQRSDHHCTLRMLYTLCSGDIRVDATVHLTFDPSPLIRWNVDLDTHGANFRVDMIFETANQGQIHAGMPFDIVPRSPVDTDLLPRQLGEDLSAILMGQRELGSVRSFPFHDFIAITDNGKTSVVFAKGIHAYQADGRGRIALTMRRSVEWLTDANLEQRVGDAGPNFYVPDARCERTVSHELVFAVGGYDVDDARLLGLNASFQNPSIIVETFTNGEQKEWGFLREELPLSCLCLSSGKILARIYNPTLNSQKLNARYTQTDVWGNPGGETRIIPPKKIITVALDHTSPPEKKVADHKFRVLSPMRWRVGNNHGLPDPKIIAQLKEEATGMQSELHRLKRKLARSSSRERDLLQHRYYVLQRGMYETLLTAQLNEQKLAMSGVLTHEYLYDPNDRISEIGLLLNQARIKRRIFDYVVQLRKG